MDLFSGFEPRFLLLGGALILGLAFGALARASAFCLRSAVLEFRAARPGPKALSYAAALGAAVAAAQALHLSGQLDLGESLYLTSVASLPAVAFGGLAFGAGLTLARGCGARHLVLAAGGNLRSWFVVTLLGLVAYATLRGILAPLRVWIEGLAPTAAQDMALPGLLGLPAAPLAALVALAAAALALVAFLRERDPRAAAGHLAAGLGIGLAVAGGWWVTGVLGFDDFDPVAPASLTFTAPLGNGLQYLMTYTGAAADFGIASIGGTFVGALLVALARRDLRLEGFERPRQLLRYAGGAALMGFGGVLALGCTIGAGLTGLSTLSLASLVALTAIVVGTRATAAVLARADSLRLAPAPAE
jgi:uncharacterized membrane protein YedE/YeeE